MNIKNIILFSLLFLLHTNTFAVTDPYKAIIDTEIYFSEKSIYIIQFVYNFDYAKSHIEGNTKASKVILVEKQIVDEHLITINTSEYSSYFTLIDKLKELHSPIKARPAIEYGQENFRDIITSEYIEEHVSSLFKKEQIQIMNISTVYVFDGSSPTNYNDYLLVQVDYSFKQDQLNEYYRKTVLIKVDEL